MRLLAGPGERNDITKVHDLIEGFEADAVIADKGYDAEHLRESVRKREVEPVIPSKSSRCALWNPTRRSTTSSSVSSTR